MEDINGHDFDSKLFLKYVPARLITEGANACQHISFLKAHACLAEYEDESWPFI